MFSLTQALLKGTGFPQLGNHEVEGIGELADFIVALNRYALVKITGSNPHRGINHSLDRARIPLGKNHYHNCTDSKNKYCRNNSLNRVRSQDVGEIVPVDSQVDIAVLCIACNDRHYNVIGMSFIRRNRLAQFSLYNKLLFPVSHGLPYFRWISAGNYFMRITDN